MTYDVQRWELVLVNASGSGYYTRQAANGQWVLAADAEAHEKAAVQQTIIDCMNVVKELAGEDHPDVTWLTAGLVLASLGDLLGDEDEKYRAIYS